MRDQSAAEAPLQKAVKVSPRSTDARLALGAFRLLTGKPDEALAWKWTEAEAVYQKLAERKPE